MITNTEFKNYIDLTGSDYDSAIALIVAGVNSFIEGQCNNKLLQGDVEEIIDDDDIIDGEIFLANRINITNFKIYKNTGTDNVPAWTQLSTSEFIDVLDEGRVVLDGVSGTGGSLKAYKLTYSAGYSVASAPADLKMACLKLASAVFNKRKADGESSESLEGASVNFEGQFNSDIKGMISKYKMINL